MKLQSWRVIVTKSDNVEQWKKDHELISTLIDTGWVIQVSHAVADSTSLVVYFFMVLPS